ncbi:FliH/SctL family protein [Sporosalibacterium faouarense]|uniref:FliH/SctL family protein n=1 Tax=Sporosalibacterium faouarense TaxID=516123 RepID=UPI00192A91E3|nr:FliH/SctL family protein [Sporosalibacterium faouarense]
MSSIIKSSYVIKTKPQKTVETKVNNIDAERNILEEKLAEANKRYEEIIAEAQEKAKEIIDSAKSESESHIEEAYSKASNIVDEARKEGYEKGYNEGKTESDELIKEANQIKREYFTQRENLLNDLEDNIIELVINVCDKILGDLVEDNKEAILSIISKGIGSLNTREKMTIRVSEEDYDFVEMSKDRILAMANLVEDIEIKVDSSLEAGGCVIETSKGSVDSSLRTQFEEIKDLLQNLLNGE